MRFKKIGQNIYAVEGNTTQELAKLFVRFQEHYESPKFRNKVFSLKEFKEWYKKSKKVKKFTYYDEWVGFNIPGYVLNKFLDGSFNPLSAKEKWLLSKIKKHKISQNIYIIGYKKDQRSTIDHELGHALFYTNKQYRKNVLRILKKYDLVKLKQFMQSLGYHKSVLTDEAHAYIFTCQSMLKHEKLWNRSFCMAEKELIANFRSFK